MALTVTYEVKCTVQDSDGNSEEWPSVVKTLTTTGDNMIAGQVTTSTTATALALGDVTLGAGALCLFRNMSSTAAEYITLQETGTNTNTVLIAAGADVLCMLDSTGMAAFLVDAASGTPVLKYWIIDP